MSALEKDGLGEPLLVIDDAIVDNIVDHNDEPDETGIQLQSVAPRKGAWIETKKQTNKCNVWK